MEQSAGAGPTEQQAAALEIARREALRSGRSLRAVLTVVRVSQPPTKSEQRLLAAIRLLRSPHAIMPHACKSIEEWRERYARHIGALG
jgi:hypothetical protein